LITFIDHDAGNASWFDGLSRSCSGPEVRFWEVAMVSNYVQCLISSKSDKWSWSEFTGHAQVCHEDYFIFTT
jgi:hypothetical protein